LIKKDMKKTKTKTKIDKYEKIIWIENTK